MKYVHIIQIQWQYVKTKHTFMKKKFICTYFEKVLTICTYNDMVYTCQGIAEAFNSDSMQF